jgi:hypothetical protein
MEHGDGAPSPCTSTPVQGWKVKGRRYRGTPSPIVEGAPAPWVKGHSVLTEKNGTLVLIPASER